MSKRQILASALSRSGARAVIGKIARWSGVVTLAYHRIGDPAQSPLDRALFSATQDDFDVQVRFLKKNFDIISPGDLPGVLKSARGRHVMITFDDGYLDNFTAALPVLKSHDAPATFFIATGFIDSPRIPWWDEIALRVRCAKKGTISLAPFIESPVDLSDPNRAIKLLLLTYKNLSVKSATAFLAALSGKLPLPDENALTTQGPEIWMNWDQIRLLKAAKMTLGGHTHSHQLLSRMSDQDQAREVATCKARIAAETGEQIRAFAYPIGKPFAFNDASKRALAAAAIPYGFSFYGGHLRHPHGDLHDIPRMAVEAEISADCFKTMMTFPSFSPA